MAFLHERKDLLSRSSLLGKLETLELAEKRQAYLCFRRLEI